jgi:tetratricopeptide (TPR) repeat protein
VSRCDALVEAEQFAEAAPYCLALFVTTGAAAAGLGAARSLWELERDDDVLRITSALIDGPLAGWAHYLRARVELARGSVESGHRDLRIALVRDLAAQDHGGAARDLSALATSLWKASRYREAITAAEEMQREAIAVADVQKEVWALVELGDLWTDVGDLDRAAAAYERAARRGPDARANDRAAIDLKRARLELDRGHLAIARSRLGDGLARALLGGVPSMAVEARLNLAELAWREHDLAEVATQLTLTRRALPPNVQEPAMSFAEARLALAQGRTADASAVLAGVTEAIPNWMWQIEDLRGQIAEALGQPDVAVQAYRRAVAIVEHLRTNLHGNEIKAAFLAERRRPYQALFELAIRGAPGSAVPAMERLLSRSFVDAFVAAGNAREPLTRLEATPGLIRQLGTWLPDVAHPRELTAVRGAFVLAYVEGRDRMYGVVIADGRPRFVRLAVDAVQLRDLVDRMMCAPGDERAAAALGAALLPDELGPLPDGQLYIVPSGPLVRVPFALVMRGGARLGERHPLAIVPSVGVLARLLAMPEVPAGPPLVLGDPGGDLPGARAEATQVAKVLGTEARVGREATLTAFTAGANAAVLHIASHATIGPDGARLMLADASPSTSDILAARMHARVTVLASCASGVTSLPELWGSLGAAFLAAGSRSVISSLWAVDDGFTRQLVAEFYAHGGARDPAAALAAAQRAFARSSPPSDWGAFVVIGAASASQERL